MKPFAFVFPGQGSQAVGMLDAWGDHPAVRETLAEASQALGEDIAQLIHEGPKEALELFLHHLKQGPRLARVEAVEVQWGEEAGLKGFHVY